MAYGVCVLGRFRKQVERAWLLADVIRSSGAIQVVRPARLVELVRSAAKLPVGPHLAVMFHAAAHPEKEALVEYGAGGVRRMTWGELDATVNRLANALRTRGAGGGSRVALMLPNGSEFLIAHQALLRLGATAIQIGYHLKAGEIAHILRNAEPNAAIVHGDALAVMTAARREANQEAAEIIVVGGAPGEHTEWARALAAASPEVPLRPRDGDGGGMIVYTSGTTGASKGAHRSWRAFGIESVADMMRQLDVRADDRHLVVCPLYHSAAPAFVALMFAIGGTVVLMSQFDAAGALEVMRKERVTCSLMVPTMLARLANLPDAPVPSSLRWVMSVAAPLTTETARRFMARFGPVLWNFYGATETGIVTLAGPADHLARPGTIGRPLRGNEIRLLDAAGAEVAAGEVGEVYVRNAMLISGYHKNADATQASMRDGYFSVGDLGRRDDDGYYYLESRKHDMVISGGVNIYPREIEDRLHTHPAILDAAVVGVPDPEWGESLHAFVVVRDGHAVSEDEVIAYCRDGLADYKRPRRVSFVRELPRNPIGKVLKRELRDPR